MALGMTDNGESPRAVARSVKIGKSALCRHLPGARSAEAEHSPLPVDGPWVGEVVDRCHDCGVGCRACHAAQGY